jgi:predicted DNA-binding helix-hairpin-helix protein
VNTAAREALMRVPGFGRHTVKRILAARRHGALGTGELKRIGARLNIAKFFVVTRDSRPPHQPGDVHAGLFTPAPQQMALAL